MKKIPMEWVGYTTLLVSFISLEMYAIKSKKIQPFSHVVKATYIREAEGTRKSNNLIRMTLAGSWLGFCCWTIWHFFFEDQ